MEVVMQMMYSYSLELLAAAVGLMLLLELVTLRKINKWKKKEKEQFFELEEKLSRISEKQNETAREITQQAQDDKMAQKSGENPEKEAPEKLTDAVLTEVFSSKLDNFISDSYNRSSNKFATIITIMNKTQQRCNII